VGSLSKTLAPGLRMGYLVGPPALIQEARALRRLMLRHPPANNQRTLALFLAGGYHDSLIRRLTGVYRERRELLIESLAQQLPAVEVTDSDGGSSIWCRAPAGADMPVVQQRALEHGVFIEAAAPFFFGGEDGSAYFRMGYSAIASEAIEAGVCLLAQVMNSQ
jgi:GntR family transcriptional regulator/MocR family aminotransferase